MHSCKAQEAISKAYKGGCNGRVLLEVPDTLHTFSTLYRPMRRVALVASEQDAFAQLDGSDRPPQASPCLGRVVSQGGGGEHGGVGSCEGALLRCLSM